ncbi:MAG: dephospho-CoA kinase [Candidatus Krumholzibacteria bacterium]|nr:dephospho-CoA kinase [Candidatus Krumholzibacteria bacterium]MDH4337970.1 dephospho-CoA kinase [Candidatus Krumholzibacteria bacterium]MDH5268889.1 dephospho-CoA kinase [Candidatus Krumholzibacteria bacterium]MDH5626844.1 dephospho-CoA kinase [Candidatus Krumholzibacteria bacterium]
MIVVGIAGGSGTGKSTIARYLAERFRGVHIDADRVAHAALAEDAAVLSRLREAFGEGVFNADGSVNRLRLGRRVFADPALLARLNAIVHPAVMARCAVAVEAAREAGARVAVVDAALLFEVAMPFDFDMLIGLTCDPQIRLARIMAKGGWVEADVRARLARQQDMEKHFYKADAVVDTGRDLSSVLKDVGDRVAAALDAESNS